MTQSPQHWVVRAGQGSISSLKKGYRHYPNTPYYGCSVQYDPHVGVDELARAGKFKNGEISYATRPMLERVLAAIGYTMQLIKTPGSGYHHTLMVLYAGGNGIIQLPDDAAKAIHDTFSRKPNPYPVP